MSQENKNELHVLPVGDYMVEVERHTFQENSLILYFALNILDSPYVGTELHVYFHTALPDAEARKRQYNAYIKFSEAACGYIVALATDIPEHLYAKRLKVHVGIREKDGVECNVVETYMALDGPRG